MDADKYIWWQAGEVRGSFQTDQELFEALLDHSNHEYWVRHVRNDDGDDGHWELVLKRRRGGGSWVAGYSFATTEEDATNELIADWLATKQLSGFAGYIDDDMDIEEV